MCEGVDEDNDECVGKAGAAALKNTHIMTDYRKHDSTFTVHTCVWDHTYAEQYYERFLSKDVTIIFEQATELINIDVDASLDFLHLTRVLL